MSNVIIITGVSSGIGKEFVKLAGDKLLDSKIIAITRGHLDYKPSKNVDVIEADISKIEDYTELIKYIIKKYKHIDVLINNAGNGMRGTIDSTSRLEIYGQMSVNLWPVIGLMQAVIPYMKKQKYGQIINISSLAATVDYPTLGYYGAIKGFVEKVSRISAMELKPWNIKVSVLIPGAVKSNFGRSMKNSKNYETTEYDSLRKTWEDRFGNLFKHASPPWTAAYALMKLVDDRKPTGFVKFSDRLVYVSNHIFGSRLFSSGVMIKLHMHSFWPRYKVK